VQRAYHACSRPRPGLDFCVETWPRSEAENYSCERVVEVEAETCHANGYHGGGRRWRSSRVNRQVLGDGEIVVQTVNYSEVGVSCRAGRHVLCTVNRTPLA
jgi:hypothetical protein